MKIGILGTGMVGVTLGNKLVSLGHEVKMGSRTANNEKAAAWAKAAGSQGLAGHVRRRGGLSASCSSTAPAAHGSLEALKAAGAANLKGKVLVDISNPLDFSKGMPPTLFSGQHRLAGRAGPGAPSRQRKVVKTLNTVTAAIMVDPGKVAGGDHHLFLCGNDAGAKATVSEFLKTQFGWKHIVDLGDISQSRGTEMFLALWIRIYGALKTAEFNIKIVR